MEDIKNLLADKKRIVITTHINPDGDALGSSIGLHSFLDKMGHEVCTIIPNDYPNYLSWMVDDEDLINFSDNKKKSSKKIEESEVIFCLDFNNLDRIKELGDLIEVSRASKILIDHHLEPTKFYNYSIHNASASATAELVYDLMYFMDKKSIDKKISECIYAGILTDTGSFKFPSTSSKVHRIISDLINRGINISKINREIYDNNSIDKIKLIGFALSQKLEIISNGNVAFISLSRKELKDHNFKKGDTEGLVNFALSISKVNMAILMIETKERIKFSFRSVGQFSVNEFAKAHFNGGGHKNAAGGSLDCKLSVALDKLLKSISKYSHKLNY